MYLILPREQCIGTVLTAVVRTGYYRRTGTRLGRDHLGLTLRSYVYPFGRNPANYRTWVKSVRKGLVIHESTSFGNFWKFLRIELTSKWLSSLSRGSALLQFARLLLGVSRCETTYIFTRNRLNGIPICKIKNARIAGKNR